jgi:lysophospholipase L1-like esterase
MRCPLKPSAVIGLLMLLILGAGCTSTRPVTLPPLSPANRWAKEIGAFDAQDATNPPPRRPIVFTGSSSIRLWKELPRDYPGLRVMNRGFGGSHLSDVQEHFERLILRYQPRQVVLYAGANDLAAKKSVETVVADLQAVVNRIHRELPRTKVAFISIALNPARWEQRDAVRAANAAIAEFMAQDARRQFIDVTTPMLGPDGQPRPDIFVADRLHMNRKGYEIWVPLVRSALVK